MSKEKFTYLKAEDIKKLANYEFAPKQIVEGYLAGRHKSAQRGLSSEFRDYRAYTPGDSLKALDWKVLARTDKYFVKTFDQETNTSCYIMLDSSASMGFGSSISKLEYSSFFCAALSYLITKSNNLVSLELFDDKIRSFFPLGSTVSHLHGIMNVLENNKAGNETSIVEALRKSFPLYKRKGSLVIISDFYEEPAKIFSELNRYLHKGFKVYLFHILTPEEINLKPSGLNLFVDSETKTSITVHTESIRKTYNKTISEHISAMRKLSIMRQVEYVSLTTDTHYFKLFDRLVK